jgi:hypothetical protein
MANLQLSVVAKPTPMPSLVLPDVDAAASVANKAAEALLSDDMSLAERFLAIVPDAKSMQALSDRFVHARNNASNSLPTGILEHDGGSAFWLLVAIACVAFLVWAYFRGRRAFQKLFIEQKRAKMKKHD